MKKLMLVVAVVFLSLGVACADGDRPIAIEQLPQSAQQFLKSHYPKGEVLLATEEGDIIGNEYEVVFADGTKIEFISNGEWKSVECNRGTVPAAIIPEQIKSFIDKNYPQVRVIKIERDRREYEVSLSNRLELTFNKSFQLVEIDD